MDDILRKISPYARRFESDRLTGIQWVNRELYIKKVAKNLIDDGVDWVATNFGVQKRNDGCFYIDFNCD